MTDYQNTSGQHRDPVCGMVVSSDSVRAVYGGRTYYFCAQACKMAFEKSPEPYLSKNSFFLKRWWDSYLRRLNKITGGKARCCH